MAKKEKKEKPEKRRRFPWGLIVLLIIILAVAAFLLFVRADRRSEVTAYRGTVISERYCFYNEKKNEIVSFGLSSGPKVYTSADPEFAEMKSQLKPADTTADNNKYKTEVGAVFGESFINGSYKYIDENDDMVLFSYPSNGTPALWYYNTVRNTVSMLIEGADIKGIAYGNGIVYARNETLNETLCYRVSTSYMGDILSVTPVCTVTSSPVSFWYMTMIDFAKGIIKGFKASRASG